MGRKGNLGNLLVAGAAPGGWKPQGWVGRRGAARPRASQAAHSTCLPRTQILQPWAGGAWGRALSLVTKPSALFLGMELTKGASCPATVRAAHPFWGRICWKPGMCSWCTPRGAQPCCRALIHPSCHGASWCHGPSGGDGATSALQAVAPGGGEACAHAQVPLEALPRSHHRSPGFVRGRGRDGAMGSRTPRSRPGACLVRSDQEEDQSAPRTLSRFN